MRALANATFCLLFSTDTEASVSYKCVCVTLFFLQYRALLTSTFGLHLVHGNFIKAAIESSAPTRFAYTTNPDLAAEIMSVQGGIDGDGAVSLSNRSYGPGFSKLPKHLLIW